MSNQDDDLPKLTADQSNDDFRVREKNDRDSRNQTQDDYVHDEGMPSVNRKKGSNKVLSGSILALAIIGGLSLIYMVNFAGPKELKKVEEKKASTSSLPPIDFTPPPPKERPIPKQQASANNQPNGSAPPVGSGQQKDVNGKPVLSWYDRKLIGDVIVQPKGASSSGSNRTGGASSLPGGRVPDYGSAEGAHGGSLSRDSLGGRLQGTPMVGVSAGMLADRNFLVTQGTPIDCTLDVAIDTTLPGVIACTQSRDLYSANGQVLLLARGTKWVGEQQGNVKQGQARVFALWSRAESPDGVIINANSPGTDSLGRAGLEGWVDNHFADRFGAAFLLTAFTASLDILVESQKNDSASTVINESRENSESIIGKILDNTINIPPTIIKNQGDHINIMVARDLDFSTVYDLQVTQ